MAKGNFFKLKREHKNVTTELVKLNHEMVVQMLVLANETGDIEPLIGAVKALEKTQEIFSVNTANIETAEIQKGIGDLLLSVGKNENNERALDYAIVAYKSAITIASLLDAQNLRKAAKKNYGLARNYRGLEMSKPNMSLLGAA